MPPGDRGKKSRGAVAICALHFLRKPRAARRRHLGRDWRHYPIAVLHIAAQAIQCAVRGFLTRRRLRSNNNNNGNPGSNNHNGVGGKDAGASDPEHLSRREYAFKQKYLRMTGATGMGGLRVFAAVRVQAWFRMLLVRRRYEMLRWDVYHIAAAEIQYYYRLRVELRELYKRRGPMEVGRAAVVLQRAWRSFSDRRVFSYYRSIIQFRDRGDAASMLRAINPREAALLDMAAGAHVRFRLGGLSFPPTVYYKIFIHRALVDMCSFSPRVYTDEAAQQAAPEQLHNRNSSSSSSSKLKKGGGQGKSAGKKGAAQRKEGWYRRVENNNWRPVQVGVLRGVTEPVPSKESRPFHHDRLVRRADVERRRREKRLRWLRSMYKSGLEEQARQNTALGDYRREYGDDFEIDENEGEAHDLLRWTDSLDFNAYLENWSSLGTTNRLDPLNAEVEVTGGGGTGTGGGSASAGSDGRASSLNIGSFPSHLSSPYDFDELDIDPAIFDTVTQNSDVTNPYQQLHDEGRYVYSREGKG